MLQDLRFTFRLIAKERWFSAAAVVALALGIGVNAVGFTLVNAAFLRGLPFDQARTGSTCCPGRAVRGRAVAGLGPRARRTGARRATRSRAWRRSATAR